MINVFNSTLRTVLFGLILVQPVLAQQPSSPQVAKASHYDVGKLSAPMAIDANWNKAQWKRVKALTIGNFIREIPAFRPRVQAKMMYDDANIYVIFQVKDRYVRTVTTEVNGPVWKDAAVEFFFSPDTLLPTTFFNLEVNSGGTHLLGFRGKKPELDDIKQIEVAHTLPKTTDPEIKDRVTWVIECRIPLEMIRKYSKIVRPEKGVTWRGNLYKIAEINSNPHHIAWSEITHPKPNFHMPQFFGYLHFQ